MPERGKTAPLASVRQDLSPVPAMPGGAEIKTPIKRRNSLPSRRKEPIADTQADRSTEAARLCSVRRGPYQPVEPHCCCAAAFSDAATGHEEQHFELRSI